MTRADQGTSTRAPLHDHAPDPKRTSKTPDLVGLHWPGGRDLLLSVCFTAYLRQVQHSALAVSVHIPSCSSTNSKDRPEVNSMSKHLGISSADIAPVYSSQPQSQKGFNQARSKNLVKSTSYSRGDTPIATSLNMPRSNHRHHRKPESNLNHLLNFSYERPSARNYRSPKRSSRATPSFGRGSGHHPLDKAHFVNANFRFVVNPSGDYKANLSQPDVPLPWELVLQVLASVESQCNACPICLEHVPTAPRMAKCGHIFCLPCALSYLDSADLKTGKTTGKWRKCPICLDSIYAQDLRPVRWLDSEGPSPARGQDITLQLIRRKAGTMFALPRDADEIEDDNVPWHSQDKVLEHCRIVRGDSLYMTREFEREINDLVLMKVEDEQNFGDAGPWAAKAIAAVEDEIHLASSLGRAPKRPIQAKAALEERPPIVYKAPDVGSGTLIEPDAIFTRRSIITAHRNDALESPSGDAYFFYQPRYRINFYLSALDVRILKKAFTSFSCFPSALITKVQHMTTMTIDEEQRRRLKYLSHLPLGCEVTSLECDWAGILDDDVLRSFNPEIEKRNKKRHDNAVSEETARRRAQAAEERRERSGLGELLWQDEDSSYLARNQENNTYEIFAEELPPSSGSIHSTSLPKNSPERTSVWGTSLPSADVESAPVEDAEWKEKLEKFYEDSAINASLLETTSGQSKKGKAKKKKLVLMSSGGGRGMG